MRHPKRFFVNFKNNVKSKILNIYINITYKGKYLDKINTFKMKNKNYIPKINKFKKIQ